TPQLRNAQRPIHAQLRNSQNSRAKNPERLNFRDLIFPSCLGSLGRWRLGVYRVLGVAALGIVAASTATASNRYDPRLRFRTIRTAHFDIHAHQGEEALAIRLAVIAEPVRERFATPFAVAPAP